jgi:uncharacterized alkaline shock family protein YloU
MEVTPLRPPILGYDRLPCGSNIDGLFDQVADNIPAEDAHHQATCPHCRAALAELQTLWAPVRALASEDVRAPGGLVGEVMRRVRSLAANAWHAVLPTERGVTRIAASVIAAVARLAAQRVPGVTLALGPGRLMTGRSAADIAGPTGEAASDVGVAGKRAVIELDVAVMAGTHIPTVAQQIRESVRRDVEQLAGVRMTEVDVTVIDVIALAE